MVRTKEVGEVIAVFLLFTGLTLGFPLFLMYGLGAAENTSNLVKFFLYGLLALPVVIWIPFRVYLKNRGYFEKHPELKGFDFITIHSPEQTVLGKQFQWIRSPVRLGVVFLIIGMAFGAIVGVSGQFAPGVPVLVQGSVAESTEALGLAVEPAVSSETLFFNVGLLMSLTAGLIYGFVKSGLNLPVAVIASKVIAVPVTSLAFLFYHNFRYGAAETSQIGILMLGLITNTGTAVTHSIIPAYSIHGSGNLFHKASSSGIWANDIAVAVAMLLIFLGVVLLAFIFIWDGRRSS